ncbi:Crp/Fnr family transcriptional regulator [Latilactobacillus curvatus]|uniref:Crp/Fnr family transcriptional regulator n=1 Tax=Latilactobacillus curvatus TaxID=28038 RepID=A0AAC9UN58_LATCU|nr:Crp/Fnr family transcriptional regulator [Latilactobacillus curvatus]ASN59299.1 Crp/Fnr family transcriptional regulator [Latilactobacillus curvatus]MDG2980171.1 Crp/Fnr family transcriptional regulator [Latilactobacillus curvatus]MDT3393630.1 Crp/Fnr family transcriptional regulator [Bacillota bacterium]MED9788094.1 Crp/Fnr family transcriptional regulator [Latilactobacillus curvatus]
MTDEQHICAEIVPIFSHLDRDSLVKISAVTHHERVKKGTLVMSPMDQKRLVILAKGSIKVYQLSTAGKEQLLRMMEPGDFEGEKLLFKTEDEPLYGEVLQDSTICTLSRSAFQQLLLAYPEISLKLLEATTDKMTRLEKQANLINIESVESRIVTYLLDLAKASGETEVMIPMKLKELATYIGTTPETLSRKLKQLESHALIERNGRKIAILDYENLEDFY